jgi:hypothetical protein
MTEKPGFLFDRYFYQQQANFLATASDETLYLHYKTVGWREGLSPSPYFDVQWYLNAFEDIREAGVEPLQHFMEAGMREMRDPHPAFNMELYRDHYLKGVSRDISPIEHYVLHGWQRGFRPHPLFWNDWYERKYLPGAARQDPFYHYLTSGWRQGCNPNPLFDGAWYTKQVGNQHAVTPDPLSHYIHVGGWRLSPHPLFDPAYFQRRLPEGFRASPINLLEIYFLSASGISPCPLFDQELFEASGHVSPEGVPALVAYLEGAAGAADPHPLFSRDFYLRGAGNGRNIPEPLTDYLASGWKDARQTHPLFDPAFYRETYPDARGQDPLSHYLETGWREGRRPRPEEDADRETKALTPARHVLQIPRDHAAVAGQGAARPEDRIGVFIHIYYTDLTKEMIALTNNISRENCVLYISTDTPVKAHEIEVFCKASSRHKFEIRVFPNRGRDIAPMLCGFRDRLAEVTYGLHIHTKKSPHYANGLDEWRQHLLTETLGSKILVENILGLLATDMVGAVVPDHFEPIRPLIQWGGNFGMIKSMLGLIGEDISPRCLLDFPTGSMFWFRGDALRKLMALDLRPYHFDPELEQTDGTLAHAIERSLLYFVEAAGYRWLVTKSTTAAAKPLSRLDIIRATNSILPTKRELGPIRDYYPECTHFALWTSAVKKPRINLLCPSLDRAETYAGVSTALNMFSALREELGDLVDARLIATDMSPGPGYCPPAGYSMAVEAAADREGVDIVEDAAQRYRLPVIVRENDIFIATAWWSALNGFDLIEKQSGLYGLANRKLVYFIQDFEPGFYSWSTKFALAEQTYRRPDETISLFNTALLRSHFIAANYGGDGIVLNPPDEPRFRAMIKPGTKKERILLLYARAKADRNCLPFLDMLVKTLRRDDPSAWRGWRICAIGETFENSALKCDSGIELLGRLSLDDYASLASRAALAISLMVSPHPSYPPLEMAEAGALVLTNKFGGKDLSALHGNIHVFDAFDIRQVAAQLAALRTQWQANRQAGWAAKPKADWFFGGKTNMPAAIKALAVQIRQQAGMQPKLTMHTRKRAS